MAWLLLVAASLLEIVWAQALDRSDGMKRLLPSAIGITTAAASFYLLSIAFRSIPIGTAYAVWVGIGAVGVAVAGIVASGEQASPSRLMFLALIVIGVVGLKVTERGT